MDELRASENSPNRLPTDEDLHQLQWTTIHYYLHETNPDNGLVRDKTDLDAPSSIAPTGWWVTPYHFGVDQGPIVLMIENYRSALIWDIMRRCPYVVEGLRRAGFQGCWCRTTISPRVDSDLGLA
jgi:hypothetical protein